jgi:hypothetical protein
MRTNYWNCSKFANLIRGTKKPFALEFKEWAVWHKEAKNKHPIRYWIAEKLLKKLQNLVYFPYDTFNKIKYYYKNRFVSKTHFLKTGLKPGVYHELDDRILNGLFNELVDFVECENAYMNKALENKKYVFKKGRCAEAGLDRLKWASKLKYKNKLTTQAINAKKILKLYCWWKKRPDRPLPEFASGLNDYYKNKKYDDDSFYTSFDDSKRKKLFQKMITIEKRYDKEDENMLIELIKIRKDLWT